MLFGLDDVSALNHLNERKPRGINEDGEPVLLKSNSELEEEYVE